MGRMAVYRFGQKLKEFGFGKLDANSRHNLPTCSLHMPFDEGR